MTATSWCSEQTTSVFLLAYLGVDIAIGFRNSHSSMVVSTVYVQNLVETTELLSFIEDKTTMTTIPRMKLTKQLASLRHWGTGAS